MQIPRCSGITPRDWFTPKMRSDHVTLTERISEANALVDEFGQSRADLLTARDADLLDFDADALAGGHSALRTQAIKALQGVLRVSREVVEWLDGSYYPRLTKTADATAEKLDAAREKVSRGLGELGYVAPLPDGQLQRGCWIPQWVEQHPEVRELREQHESYHSETAGRGVLLAWQRTADTAAEMLSAVRDKAVREAAAL